MCSLSSPGRIAFELLSRDVLSSRTPSGEGPSGVLRDEGIVRRREALELRNDAWVRRIGRREAGIAEADAGVADQAVPFRALDGAASEEFAEFGLIERGEDFEGGIEQRLFL